MKKLLPVFESVIGVHEMLKDTVKEVWSVHGELEHVNPLIKYLYGDRLCYEPAFRIRSIILRTLQSDLYEY